MGVLLEHFCLQYPFPFFLKEVEKVPTTCLYTMCRHLSVSVCLNLHSLQNCFVQRLLKLTTLSHFHPFSSNFVCNWPILSTFELGVFVLLISGLGRHQSKLRSVAYLSLFANAVSGCGEMCHCCQSKLRTMCSH